MVTSFTSGFGNFNRQTGFAGGPGAAGQNRSETLIDSLRAAAETLLSVAGDEKSKGQVNRVVALIRFRIYLIGVV